MFIKMRHEAQDFSKYHQMSTGELSKIIQEDALKPLDKQMSSEELFYISDLYCSRLDPGQLSQKSTQESWEEFLTHYMPREPGEVARQQKQEEADLRETLALLNHFSTPKTRKKTRRLSARKLAVLAAAMAAAFVLLILPVSASGNSILDTIVIWAKETFQFSSSGSPSGTYVESTAFQEFLQQHGVDEPVPTLIPAEFELHELSADQLPLQIVYSAVYTSHGDVSLAIALRPTIPGELSYVEQLGGDYETLKLAGQEYFIFDNTGCKTVVWISGKYECWITGSLSFAQIEAMLHSMIKE